MTDKQQPEALRLAASLELCWGDSRLDEAAAELRRLHAELETLRAGYAAARLEIESLRGRGWVNLPGQLPEPGKPVLLDIGTEFPIRAMWAAKHTVEAGDDDTDWGEYDEATDTYYCPEGWYEWNQNEEKHWRVTSTTVAWCELPPSSAKTYTSNVSFERDASDYVDMTASLLWHGWKLRASHGQAPASKIEGLTAAQESLGVEFEKVLHDNLFDLYEESAPHGQAPAGAATSSELVATMLDALKHAQKVLNHYNFSLECAPINSAILTAKAAPQPSPAAQDAARLDWLENDVGCRVFHLGKSWYTRANFGMPYRKRASLRAAIDAASAAQEGKL